jgi:hypothetical protein
MLGRYYNDLSVQRTLRCCENKMTNHICAMQQEPQRRRPIKRKRGKPIEMDYEQTVIASSTYQSWLKDPSALVSKRGGMKKVFN